MFRLNVRTVAACILLGSLLSGCVGSSTKNSFVGIFKTAFSADPDIMLFVCRHHWKTGDWPNTFEEAIAQSTEYVSRRRVIIETVSFDSCLLNIGVRTSNVPGRKLLIRVKKPGEYEGTYPSHPELATIFMDLTKEP